MVLRFFLLACAFILASCVNIERDHPDDPGSSNYRGAKLTTPSSGSAYVVPSSSSAAVSSSSSTPSNSGTLSSSSSLAQSSSSAAVSSSSVMNSSSSSTLPSSSSSTPPSSSSVAKSSSSVAVSSSSSKPSSSSISPSSSSVVSSSSRASSSSSKPSSSSSVVVGTGLCAGFVDGTTREHYGRSKAQFCDPRDGKKYVYVTIGTQTWMAENSDYAPESKCYDNKPDNCDKYGRLYEPDRAWLACPIDWHLASKTDWSVLMESINSSCSPAPSARDMNCFGAGTKLKATSGWGDYNGKSGNGSDNYGFSALPGGAGDSRWCGGYNGDAWIMSADNDARYYFIFYNEPCSVRCVKN
ncbi:MAG: hypothetical protein FWF67_06000 [Fibromonadales bacterium]|nr:hypothetical protein [Fibromonadales bacterium]